MIYIKTFHYKYSKKVKSQSKIPSLIFFTGELEWTAIVYNLNPKYSGSTKKGCKPLYDYVQYVYRIRENQKAQMPRKNAIGIARGAEQKAIETARKLLADRTYTVNQIAGLLCNRFKC